MSSPYQNQFENGGVVALSVPSNNSFLSSLCFKQCTNSISFITATIRYVFCFHIFI